MPAGARLSGAMRRIVSTQRLKIARNCPPSIHPGEGLVHQRQRLHLTHLYSEQQSILGSRLFPCVEFVRLN
jgi:hypothetical protein